MLRKDPDIIHIPELETIQNDESSNGGIEVRARPTEIFTPTVCPICGGTLFYKHGKRTSKYADLPVHGQRVRLIVKWPRYRCRTCQTIAVQSFDFVDEKRRATKRLVERIQRSCLHRTFSALAKESGLAVNTVKNIAFDLMGHLEAKRRGQYGAVPSFLGIMPTMIAGKMRTVIVNLGDYSLYDILEECSSEALLRYFHAMKRRGHVQWICFEQEAPSMDTLKSLFPMAKYILGESYVLNTLNIICKNALQGLGMNQRRSTYKALKEFIKGFEALYETRTKEEALLKYGALIQENNAAVNAVNVLDATFMAFIKTHFEAVSAYWDTSKGLVYDSAKIEKAIEYEKDKVTNAYSFDVVRAKMLYEDYAVTVKEIVGE